jgi:hypothetical protein
LTAATAGATRCRAIDYQPFDWVPLPPGTNALMGYYEFGTRSEFNNTITGTSHRGTRLDSDIGLIRFIHYADRMVFGNPWDFNVLIPFGTLRNGEISGQHLGKRFRGRRPDSERGLLAPEPADAASLAISLKDFSTSSRSMCRRTGPITVSTQERVPAVRSLARTRHMEPLCGSPMTCRTSRGE